MNAPVTQILLLTKRAERTDENLGLDRCTFTTTNVTERTDDTPGTMSLASANEPYDYGFNHTWKA